MNRIVPALILILLLIGLSGCTSDTAKQPESVFASDEVYAGYPCEDSCEAFRVGYEAAMEAGWKSEDQCKDEDFEVVVGCRAYVADFRYENKSFEELLRDL